MSTEVQHSAEYYIPSQTFVEYTGTYGSIEDAFEAYSHMAKRIDYRGGLILQPAKKRWWTIVKPVQIWKIKVLFDANSIENCQILPNGCRLVSFPIKPPVIIDAVTARLIHSEQNNA